MKKRFLLFLALLLTLVTIVPTAFAEGKNVSVDPIYSEETTETTIQDFFVDEQSQPVTDSLDAYYVVSPPSESTFEVEPTDDSTLGTEVIHVKIDINMTYDKSKKQFNWTFDARNSGKKPPMNADFIITRSDFENGPYTKVGNLYVSNLNYVLDYRVTVPATTGHYQIKADLKARQNSDIINSPVYGRKILLNRTGNEWALQYSDATSGKILDKPPAYYSKQQLHQRPSGLAKTYKDWYDKTFNTKLDLTGYEVHHERPLAYGGDNSMANLIHLPIALHKQVTGWFAGY